MEKIGYVILIIATVCWFIAMLIGMVAAFPAGIIGLLAIVGFSILFIKVLKKNVWHLKSTIDIQKR